MRYVQHENRHVRHANVDNERNNKEKSKSQIIKEIRKSKIVNIEYNEGEIIWHNGLNLHQIEAWKSNEKTMPRITMQGHGCLIEDTMYLYS